MVMASSMIPELSSPSKKEIWEKGGGGGDGGKCITALLYFFWCYVHHELGDEPTHSWCAKKKDPTFQLDTSNVRKKYTTSKWAL